MARELVERYRVRTASVDAPIATLSEANVQRAVLARKPSIAADVLIVANPVVTLLFGVVFYSVWTSSLFGVGTWRQFSVPAIVSRFG